MCVWGCGTSSFPGFSARQAVTCSWGSSPGRFYHPWKEFSKVEHLSMRWGGRRLENPGRDIQEADWIGSQSRRLGNEAKEGRLGLPPAILGQAPGNPAPCVAVASRVPGPGSSPVLGMDILRTSGSIDPLLSKPFMPLRHFCVLPLSGTLSECANT